MQSSKNEYLEREISKDISNKESNITQSPTSELAKEIYPETLITYQSPPLIEEFVEHQLEDGLIVVKSPDGLGVSIDGYGFRLTKKSERMVVKKADGKTVWQFPLSDLSDIFVLQNGSFVSTDLIGEAATRGIALHVINSTGRPVAQLQSPVLNATIETKRAQIQAGESKRGRELAIAFAAGKVLNQSRLLRYFGKYLTQTDPKRAEQVNNTALDLLRIRQKILRIEKEDSHPFRQSLMGLEGNAAALYWEVVGLIVQTRASFSGREHQGATDPINCMLNYGYGILYAHIWSAVLRAGLEPFAGFLHADRSGKPSLVLDLTEEFRAPVVDRTVIASINLNQIATLEKGRLTQESRAELADKVLRRLETRETFSGKSLQIRSIIQMQARQVASYLRGQTDRYRPFRFKW